VSDPLDYYASDELRLRTGFEIEPVLVGRDELLRAVDQFYAVQSSVERAAAEVVDLAPAARIAGLEDGDASAVATLVNEILTLAVRQQASDIHFEPVLAGVKIRVRIDGVLRTERMLPTKMAGIVTARLKLISGLDLTERRLPQDGRIRAAVDQREVDFRVSTLPISGGEKVVVRVLDAEAGMRRLSRLGFTPRNLQTLERALHAPYGMVLVTGPTGSGKTSTLYGALLELNTDSVNVVTLEDPIEYQLQGINQVQVNPAIGLTFAQGLRAILRQDPNVVMVGEIRDTETAEMGLRAALTGHLLISTIHTNHAAGAITRLLDMGLQSFLIAPALRCVLAQRLVRRLCPHCSQLQEVAEDDRAPFAAVGLDVRAVRRSVGCPVCLHTGYHGRLALLEALEVTDDVRRLIVRGGSEAEILAVARSQGMRTLYDDGLVKVAAGETSLAEVFRVTQA